MRCAEPRIENNLDVVMTRSDMAGSILHYVGFLRHFLGHSPSSAIDVDVKLVELCQLALNLLIEVRPVYRLVGALQTIVFLLIIADLNILIILQLPTLHSYLPQSLYHLVLRVELQRLFETGPRFFVLLLLHQKQPLEHMCLVIVIGVRDGDTGILKTLGVPCPNQVHAGEAAAQI